MLLASHTDSNCKQIQITAEKCNFKQETLLTLVITFRLSYTITTCYTALQVLQLQTVGAAGAWIYTPIIIIIVYYARRA